MNFYGISKFTAKITKESLKILFICVTGFADSPLELLFLLTWGPWPGQRGAVVVRPNPARGVTGGEGGGVWKVQKSKAHLWVVLG